MVQTRFVLRHLNRIRHTMIEHCGARAIGQIAETFRNHTGFQVKVNFRWNDPNLASYVAVV